MHTRPLAVALTAVVLAGFLPPVAQGVIVVVPLEDRNSTLNVVLQGGIGMTDWTVDGASHLSRQWFWYRIGPSGGESTIEVLGWRGLWNASDNDWDVGNEHLAVLYGDPNVLTVELSFTLAGGNDGSRQSDIAETVTITNHGATTLDLHFFQYCDLDLGGTSEDLYAAIVGGNTAQQQDTSDWFSEAVTTPMPSHREVSTYNSLLASLNDAGPTTLSDQVGPIGPGNLVWGFQWDFTIRPDRSVIISKDKLIVPEPAAAVLVGLGAVGLISRRPRRACSKRPSQAPARGGSCVLPSIRYDLICSDLRSGTAAEGTPRGAGRARLLAPASGRLGQVAPNAALVLLQNQME